MASRKVDARAISGTPPRSLVRFYQRITRAVFRVQETEGGKEEEKGERGEAVECPLASKTRTEWNRTKEGGEDARQSESVVVENALSFLLLLCSPRPLARQRDEEREKSQVGCGPRARKFTTPFPFALHHPRHNSVMATRGGSARKRLLLNLPDRKTHDGVDPRGYVLSACKNPREWRLALSTQREREREGGGITLSVQVARGVRLPPETLWRRVFPFACSSSPRLSVPLSGEWYISSRGYFLSLSRRYRRPFKRCSRRYITLIRSLTVFCRGGCLVPRTRCFREFVVAPFDRLPASVRFSKNEILPWTINFNAWTEEWFLARG